MPLTSAASKDGKLRPETVDKFLMKTIEELSAEQFESPDSLKRRAMHLHRLADSINAQRARLRATDNGLTAEELRTLKGAADIFSTLARRIYAVGREKKKLLVEQKINAPNET